MTGPGCTAKRLWISALFCCGFASSALAQRSAQGIDVDALMTRATTLRRQNRKAEAATVLHRGDTVAVGRADFRRLHDLLEFEVHGAEASLGMTDQRWSERLPEWREAQAALRKNTVRGPVIARVSHLQRAGLDDDKLEIEAYPAFRGGYAALSAGFAPDAQLYAHSTVSAEVYVSVTGRIEASAGYRRLRFESPVHVWTGYTGAYYGEYLFGARVNHVVHAGESVILSSRRYLSDDGQYLGLTFATGAVPVVLNSSTDFESRFSHSIGADALFIVRSRWVLTGQTIVGREGLAGGGTTSSVLVRAGVGVRF